MTEKDYNAALDVMGKDAQDIQLLLAEVDGDKTGGIRSLVLLNKISDYLRKYLPIVALLGGFVDDMKVIFMRNGSFSFPMVLRVDLYWKIIKRTGVFIKELVKILK